MTLFFLAATGFLSYHAYQEFGTSRTILTVLATICGFAAVCGVLR